MSQNIGSSVSPDKTCSGQRHTVGVDSEKQRKTRIILLIAGRSEPVSAKINKRKIIYFNRQVPPEQTQPNDKKKGTYSPENMESA